MPHSHSVRLEQSEDSIPIASLQDIIFGEAQKVRAAYALRRGHLSRITSFIRS